MNPFEDNREQKLSEILDTLAQLTERFKENKPYLEHLRQQAKEGKLDVKPIDPQKIFEADALLKSIEDSHLEDEIEGFDRLKNAGQTYHDIRQLRGTLQACKSFFWKKKLRPANG